MKIGKIFDFFGPKLVFVIFCDFLTNFSLSASSILGPAHLIFLRENWFQIGLCYPIFTAVTIYAIVPRLRGFDSIFTVIEKVYSRWPKISKN